MRNEEENEDVSGANIRIPVYFVKMRIFSKAERGRPEGPTDQSVFKIFLSCWLFSSQLLDHIFGQNVAIKSTQVGPVASDKSDAPPQGRVGQHSAVTTALLVVGNTVMKTNAQFRVSFLHLTLNVS